MQGTGDQGAGVGHSVGATVEQNGIFMASLSHLVYSQIIMYNCTKTFKTIFISINLYF